MQRYFYRIEKICHRPTAEDKISIIKDFKDNDLQLAKLLATKYFLEEVQELNGKYSPAGYNDYKIQKGIGYNYQLLLIDTIDDVQYIVESTMESIILEVLSNKLKEKNILDNFNELQED